MWKQKTKRKNSHRDENVNGIFILMETSVVVKRRTYFYGTNDEYCEKWFQHFFGLVISRTSDDNQRIMIIVLSLLAWLIWIYFFTCADFLYRFFFFFFCLRNISYCSRHPDRSHLLCKPDTNNDNYFATMNVSPVALLLSLYVHTIKYVYIIFVF